MAPKIYYDSDASLTTLEGRRMAVVGYGSQGRAHALNLRDSGLDVAVGLRKDSASWARASEDGLPVGSIGEACSGADLVAVLVPDQHQADARPVALRRPAANPGRCHAVRPRRGPRRRAPTAGPAER